MMKQEDLLDKYYKGETTLEEEEILKDTILAQSIDSAEKDMFGYFQNEGEVPEDLEERIFSEIKTRQQKNKTLKMRIFGLSSAAAILLILLTVYLDFRNTEKTKIENDFFVMEQALFQVSESIQPEEQDEMLVLWVDNDVEIIIN